ncbi:MAG: ABC transporter permease, partial [Cytophagaceae bacterium]|nr:ABC transporter permease [Gemmatimonadaceae bacterium]
TARRARGLQRVDELRISWLDFKLGFRMLARYPGLTAVAGVAIAFGMAAGVSTFLFVGQVLYPTLPLDEGDRVVGVRHWDAATSRITDLTALDVVTWRSELSLVQDVGAYRTIQRNLVVGDQPHGEPVMAAAMSASGFRVARVAPLVGRPLADADEVPGASPVAVLGYDVWKTRFGGDVGVVGRTVRLGRDEFTVVGVMPEGFAFPVFHKVWVPLTLDAGAGASATVARAFGRLAPGTSLREAQSQLSAITLRRVSERADSLARQSAELLPYATSIFDVSRLETRALMSLNLVAVLFLVLVCGNVAMLMFARATAREGEIVVRTALGASAGRIVMQLFAEALVLGSLAAGVGIFAAHLVVREGLRVIEASEGQRPFWFSDTPSASTLVYAAALTLLVAVVTGVWPALKVTRGLATRLRETTAGGGGVKFGGVWTAVIVAQVAITVAFPASTFFVRRDGVQIASLDVGFPAEEYLSVRLEADPEGTVPLASTTDPSREDIGVTLRELQRRLDLEPGVVATTFADALPRMSHAQRAVEVEGASVGTTDHVQAPEVSAASVTIDYFQALVAPVTGRSFHPGDVPGRGADVAGVVIVNESFVRHVLGGRNAIGRRVRYAADDDTPIRTDAGEPPPWHEIIGVVKDLGMTSGGDATATGAGLYHPVAPGTLQAVHLAIRVRGADPGDFATRLRDVAHVVDPSLRLESMMRLDEVLAADLRGIDFWVRVLLIASSLALLLSLAGIYSVMSFTVSRRTREIGVRVALGADARGVTRAVLARPLAQVAGGV